MFFPPTLGSHWPNVSITLHCLDECFMTVLCMDEKRASPFSPGMVKSGNQGSRARGSCK
jgi:hypothetical protein